MQIESAEKPKLELITASESEPKEVQWLWYPYLPLGKVSIVQGDPGDGKSTFLLTIAAKLTNGEILPFTEPETPPEPMKVVYQTTEDDADDTVVPRFMKAGVNRDRLIFIKETQSPLTFADERIGDAIKATGAKLMILDPLSSYIGDCSLNAANEVRPQFNHLIRAAKENGCTIIVVDHMNKIHYRFADVLEPLNYDAVRFYKSEKVRQASQQRAARQRQDRVAAVEKEVTDNPIETQSA